MSIHLTLFCVASASILFQFALAINWSRTFQSDISWASYYLFPSQLMLIYTYINFLFGAILFDYSIVYWKHYLEWSENWWAITVATIGLGFFLSTFISGVFLKNRQPFYDKRISRRTAFLKTASLLIFIFVLSIAFNNISLAILLLWTVLVFYVAINYQFSLIAILLLSVISLFVLFESASDSKRILVFPIFILLLVHFAVHKVRIYKALIAASVIVVGVVLLSIGRGYGNISGNGVAFSLVDSLLNYISSPILLEMIGNNFEFTYHYFHSVNAIDIYLKNDMVVYGSTIIQLITAIPRYLGWDDGLQSSIEIYTGYFSPSTLAIGGSFPQSFMSELVLNFSIIGVLVFPMFLVSIDKVFLYAESFEKIIDPALFKLIILYVSLYVIRGAGLSLSLFYLIHLLFFAIIITFVFRLRLCCKNKGVVASTKN